jgi:mannosyltransferase
MANIAALHWLGTMTGGRMAGLIGAVLLALSPFHMFYSQEARMYSPSALAATRYAASFYYMRAPLIQRSAWVALAGLVLVYSHPYGSLTWITIAVGCTVFLFLSTSPVPRSMLVWMASNVVIAVGFVPWAVILSYGAHVIERRFLDSASFLTRHFYTMLDVSGGMLLGSIIFIGVVLGVFSRLHNEIVALCVWIVAPAAIGIAASTLSTPIFWWRYVMGSLPPLLLVSAFGWTRYKNDRRRAALSIATIALAVSALWRFNSSHLEKADRRGRGVLSGRAGAADRSHPYRPRGWTLDPWGISGETCLVS